MRIAQRFNLRTHIAPATEDQLSRFTVAGEIETVQCSSRVEQKAAGDCRTPKPCGIRTGPGGAIASWTAAVPCRFRFRTAITDRQF